MGEIVSEAVSPVNIILTVLLGLVFLYWLSVILGALDVEFLDIDLHDPAFEAEAEADLDADAPDAGFLRHLLHFFYIGEVPVMIILSVLILSLWTVSMLANHYLNPAGSVLIAGPLLLVNLFLSAILCKAFTAPLRKVYLAMEKDPNGTTRVVGRICTVITTEVSDQMGQAQIKTKGSPVVLNVKAQQSHTFKRGDEALVIEKDVKTGIYIIAPIQLEK